MIVAGNQNVHNSPFASLFDSEAAQQRPIAFAALRRANFTADAPGQGIGFGLPQRSQIFIKALFEDLWLPGETLIFADVFADAGDAAVLIAR